MNYSDAERAANLLAEGLDEVAAVVADQVGLPDEARKLRHRAEQVRADRFKVVVVGEFKRGKSTLLNAMLGTDALPQKVAPCTAVVTVIQYAEAPEVRVAFADGSPEETLSPEEFRSRYELKVEDAETTVQGDFDRFSRVDHAELRYPIELCRHRVELVDSPGLGEHRTRTLRTQGFLDRADAVVMVLDATQLLKLEEVHFLETVLLPRGLKNIFFVINKWNLVEESVLRPEDAEANFAELEARVREKLTPFCVINGIDRSSERIFRVNALGALRARLARPPKAALLEESNVPAFEAALQKFLVEERGKARTEVGLAMLRSTAEEVNRYVNAQIALVSRSVAEIEAKRESLQPKLERLRGIKKHIEEFLLARSESLQDRLVISFQKHLKQMDEELPQVVDEFGLEELTGKGGLMEALTGILTGKSVIYEGIRDKFRSAEDRFAKKVEEFLRPRVTRYLERNLAGWRSAVNRNEMPAAMLDVEKYLQEEAAEYQRVLREIEERLGVSFGEQQVMELVDRWLGHGEVRSGGVRFDPTGVGVGVLGDFSWLMMGVATDVALNTSGMLIPGIGLVITGFRLVYREAGIREEMRGRIIAEVRKKLGEVAETQAAEIRGRVREAFDLLRTKVIGSIEEEITLIDASLRALILRKQEQEFSAEQEKARLSAAREAIASATRRVQAGVAAAG